VIPTLAPVPGSGAPCNDRSLRANLIGMKRWFGGLGRVARQTVVLGLISVLGCQRAELPLAERFDLPHTGPTAMSRVAEGYELKNRQIRIVIDEVDGRIVYWGSADGQRNLLGERGVSIALASLPASAPVGYVEKRDDQTWQYIGEDPQAHVGWRRIYCLEGLSLLATFIVQNTGDQPIDSSMTLRAHLADPGGRRIAQADLFTMQSTLGLVSIRGFRETPGMLPADAEPATLLSDRFQLQPGERYSFTTEWRIDPTFSGRQ